MGAFGYEEHENDDFLDFVSDDLSQENLLAKIKSTRYSPKLLVGIINKLTPSNRKVVAKSDVSRGLNYLRVELENIQSNELSWRTPEQRTQALKRQIRRLERLIGTSRSKSRSRSKSSKKRKSTRKRSRRKTK